MAWMGLLVAEMMGFCMHVCDLPVGWTK
jgi:hypothetical protein